MCQPDDPLIGQPIDSSMRRARRAAKMPGVVPLQHRAMTSATPRADRNMLSAAVLFTAATVFGSMVAIRRDLAGEPFGIRLTLPVPTAVTLGWGTALSAPWPMPAAALVAARRASRSTGPGPGLVQIGLGTAGLIGGLGEPVVRTANRQTSTVRAAIAINLLAAGALIAAGLRQASRKSTP